MAVINRDYVQVALCVFVSQQYVEVKLMKLLDLQKLRLLYVRMR